MYTPKGREYYMKNSVILIDDEPMIVDNIKQYIKWDDLGYVVAGVFYSGEDALSFLAHNNVDLVITDIQMGAVSGLDVCKYLKENAPKTKTVILSAHTNFNYAIEAMRYNAIDYILKTSTLGEITEKLIRIRNEHLHFLLEEDSSDESFMKNAPKKVNHYLIQNALDYIQENIEHDLSLETVSEYLHLSSSYFSKLFKTETGITFKNYMIKQKINYAKKLLKNPQYKIYDVADKCGYKSEQFFSAVFKAQCGYTPMEYRKNLPKDSEQ